MLKKNWINLFRFSDKYCMVFISVSKMVWFVFKFRIETNKLWGKVFIRGGKSELILPFIFQYCISSLLPQALPSWIEMCRSLGLSPYYENSCRVCEVNSGLVLRWSFCICMYNIERCQHQCTSYKTVPSWWGLVVISVNICNEYIWIFIVDQERLLDMRV